MSAVDKLRGQVESSNESPLSWEAIIDNADKIQQHFSYFEGHCDKIYDLITKLADNLRTTQVAIEQRDMKIGELDERVKALEERLNPSHLLTSTPVKYACHCDLEPHMKPDECVLIGGNIEDCRYAKEDMKPSDCKYWRPVEKPDLDDQIGICVARLLASDPVDWYDVLRAFAAELGCKP